MFTFKTKDTVHAVRKAVHLVHDILQDYLNDGRYACNTTRRLLQPESRWLRPRT